MPSGRKPDGDAPLSNAERQARYRLRHQVGQPAPVARRHRADDRRSRPRQLAGCRRWSCSRCRAVYAAWLEALPDTLQGTATADALQGPSLSFDLEMLAAIEPPQGYGRD